MRKAILLVLPVLAIAQILPHILAPPVPHFVDTAAGNDTNNGLTTSTAWATLAHADSVLPTNAPLMLKYPDSTWHPSPSYWHGLVAFYPMVVGSVTTTAYDVANAHNCAKGAGTVAYDNTTYPGESLASSGYNDCGASALGIGTGDQTVLAAVYPGTIATTAAILANGTLAGSSAGYALYMDTSNTIGYQLRNASNTLVGATTTAYVTTQPRVLVGTTARSSSTGMNLYVDGTLANTQNPMTFSGANLTSAQHTGIGARFSGGTAGLFLTANWIAELRVYNVALGAADVSFATTEAANRMYGFFGSGTYYSNGFTGSWSVSTASKVQVAGSAGVTFWDLTFRGNYTGSPQGITPSGNTYTSGITATGSATQTCTLTNFNNGGSASTATVALTGTNTIAGGTGLTITNPGSGLTSAPTSATAGNGSATCSGTAVVSTTLATYVGNLAPLCLVTAKCNGSLPSHSGEVNWIRAHEVPPIIPTPDAVDTSYDGQHWAYSFAFSNAGGSFLTCVGNGSWFVDSGDPSVFSHIHYLCFGGTGSTNFQILETHATASDYAANSASWSTPVLLLAPGAGHGYFNPAVGLSSGTYYMVFSDFDGTSHFMDLATCTSNCFTGQNWTVTQTGNWNSWGVNTESFSLTGSGANWRVDLFDLTNGLQKYATTTNTFGSFSALTNKPTQSGYTAVGVIKLQ